MVWRRLGHSDHSGGRRQASVGEWGQTVRVQGSGVGQPPAWLWGWPSDLRTWRVWWMGRPLGVAGLQASGRTIVYPSLQTLQTFVLDLSIFPPSPPLAAPACPPACGMPVAGCLLLERMELQAHLWPPCGQGYRPAEAALWSLGIGTEFEGGRVTWPCVPPTNTLRKPITTRDRKSVCSRRLGNVWDRGERGSGRWLFLCSLPPACDPGPRAQKHRPLRPHRGIGPRGRPTGSRGPKQSKYVPGRFAQNGLQDQEGRYTFFFLVFGAVLSPRCWSLVDSGETQPRAA